MSEFWRDDRQINYNLERSHTDNTGKTESGGSNHGENTRKDYRNKGILDDLEEDIDIDGYKEYKKALLDYKTLQHHDY